MIDSFIPGSHKEIPTPIEEKRIPEEIGTIQKVLERGKIYEKSCLSAQEKNISTQVIEKGKEAILSYSQAYHKAKKEAKRNRVGSLKEGKESPKGQIYEENVVLCEEIASHAHKRYNAMKNILERYGFPLQDVDIPTENDQKDR